MQAKTFSDRDCESIQQVYGNIIESYFENPCPQVQTQLLWLNNLFTQAISSSNELKTQKIISRLQPLKIKARSNQALKNSIISTIQHFGKPINQKIRAETIEECLKLKQLYQITCLVIQRLGKTKIKELEIEDIDRIFRSLLSGNTNLLIMVETMISVMNNKSDITEDSKIVETSIYLFDNYFKQSLKKKQNALKCLKIFLKASKFEVKLIHGRENLFAQAIYQQSPIVIRIQELLNICYEETLCAQFLDKISDINNLDSIYVWSYCSVFCVKFTQTDLKTLQSFLSQKIDDQAQFKIYAILNNLVTVNDFIIHQSWNIPINQTEKVINGYLALVLNVLNHSHAVNKNFNVASLQKVCAQNNYNTEVTKNLLKNLKEAIRGVFHIPNILPSPQQKGGKDKNINYLELYFAKANKIPRSDEDLKYTHEILALQLPEDQIERDNIFSLKNQAFQSLRIALIDHQCIYFQKIFNFLDWKCYDYDTFKKLVQLMGYQLRINPQSVKAIDFLALADTILQIEQKYKDVLNYLLIGELFESFFDEKEWNFEQMKGRSRQQLRIKVLELIKNLKATGKLEKKIKNFEDIMQKISSKQEDKHKEDTKMKEQIKSQEKQKEEKANEQAPEEKFEEREQEKQQLIPPICPDPYKEQEQEQEFIIQQQKVIQNVPVIEYEMPDRETKSSAKTQNQEIPKQTIEIKPEVDNQTKTEITKRNSEPAKNQSPIPQVQTKLVFKNIFQKYKIKEGVKRWFKKSKKSKQRFFNIRQWAETEKLYMEKLLTIRDKLQIPLINCELINELEANIIFPNLSAMIRLCQQMYKKLSQIIQTWSPIRTHLAPFLKSITNFLKIYKDFSFNYNKSIDMMRKLSQKAKFIQNIKLSKLELENLMFSPVQRFQKYHLFVSTYLRSLSKEHEDYKPLEEQLHHLLKVTDEINEFIQLQDKSKKMIEIQQKFGNVVSNARQYKFEFTAYNFETRCKVYVFNDLIIVAKFREQKYEEELLRMKLCSKSFVRRQQDCQSYKNRLYICGVDWSIHLNFGARADVQSVYNLLKKIVDNIFQNEYNRLDMINQNVSKLKITSFRMTKNEIDTEVLQTNTYRRLQLSVEVLGVQKISINANLKTFFVLKYQIPKPYEIYQVSLLPLDVVQTIQQHLQKLYPKTRLPSTQLKSKESNSELSRITQALSVLIERFLNFILRNKTIAQKPEFLLFQLGIDESIWSYLKTPANQLQCTCEVCLRANVFVDMDYYDKQRELIEAYKSKFCVINSFHTQNTIATMVSKKMFIDLNIEKKLVLALCFMKKIDHRLQKTTVFGKKYSFPLHFRNLTDDIVFEARSSTIYSRSREVIEDICKRLGLSTSLDLRLVLTQDDEQFIIQDDELIHKYAKILNDFQQMERKNQQGFRFTIFQRLSLGNESTGKKSKKISLSLRKIFFFDYLQEIKQCQTNPQRYNLLIGEILSKFRSHRFYLTNEERILLCGLLYSIEEFSTLDVEGKVYLKEDKLRKFLPQSDWHVLTKQFTKQVVCLVENQVKSVKNVTVLQKYFIKQFWKKCSYQYFKLLITSSNNNIFGSMKCIIIGVNSRKVSLLYKEGAPPLREYPISEFNYHIYGQNLYIDIEEVSSSLKGMNLFGLDNIIKTYKCLFQFQNKNVEE